jgi:hypothetical protein
VSDDYPVLVDFSKTAWHSAAVPFGLRRRLGEDFKLVHIVRDPRAVCWSALKRTERKGKARRVGLCVAPSPRSVGGPPTSPESSSALLGYEDVVRFPREAVNIPFMRFLLESECQFKTLGTGANRHQLYGNRMRSRPLSLYEIEALNEPLRGRYRYP